jgi:cytochrome c-type biogenesis protein CcmE
MNKSEKYISRSLVILTFIFFIGLSVALVTKVFNESILFFYTPSEVLEKKPSKIFRLGGLVKDGSIRKEADGQVLFIVTDYEAEIEVCYHGILPALFKENQGVVALGQLVDGGFTAKEILAKHDENYMPKEVADKLKKNKYWRS